MLRYLVILSVAVALAGCGKPGPSRPSGTAATAKTTPGDPIQACDTFIAQAGIDKTRSDWKMRLPEPPEFPFDPARTYYWVIDTNFGTIKVKFMPAVAPRHVSSTIYLSRLGFYDGLTFHRVIPGFMAQGGDPRGDGRGGPGYKYAGEIDDSVRHDRPGLLSMAHTKLPVSDGSQFFLTFAARPDLDGKYTIFGEIVDGMETLKELEKRGSEGGATSERLVMTKTTIEVE